MNSALQVFAAGVIFAVLFTLFSGLLFDVWRTIRRSLLG